MYIRLLKTKMPKVEQQLPVNEEPVIKQPEVAELPGSYHDILAAEDPKSVIEQLDSNPEHLDRLLNEAEQDLGVAGAELGVGRQTKDHLSEFAKKQSDYHGFIELIASHKVEKMEADGKSEEEIDQSVVDLLVESRRNVLHADISHRLDSSFVESVEEKIAKNKVRRVLGAVACAAVGVASFYATQKGLMFAGDSLGGRGDELTVLGTFGGLEVAKLGYSKISSKWTNSVNKYRPVHHRKIPEETSPTIQEELERKLVEDHAINLKKELFLITATHHENDGMSKDTLKLVIDKFDSSMDELYGLERHKISTKQLSEMGSIVLAATMVDGFADSGSITDLTNVLGHQAA